MSKPLTPRLRCLATLLQQLNAQTACEAVNEAIEAIESEALRKSQSLPAGAVAGLVGKWRDQADRFARDGMMTNDEDAASECHAHSQRFTACADSLEQALQADAREKGEGMPKHLPGWNYWRNPDTGKVTIMLSQDDLNEYVNLALATQPAQASEAGTGGAVVLDRGFRYENGVHTPTVLIGFNPNDWRARDLFASLFATSSQETASE